MQTKGVTFRVKGPMGRGLEIPTSGKCIAVTGGTGILVFIDLVAHLILRIIAEKGGPNVFIEVPDSNMINLQNFNFELYTSF